MSDPRTPAPFAGLPEHLQPSNLPACEHDWVMHMIDMPGGYSKPGATICRKCGGYQWPPQYTVTTSTSDEIQQQAVAAERRRLRQQIETLKPLASGNSSTLEGVYGAGYVKAVADILKLLGSEA